MRTLLLLFLTIFNLHASIFGGYGLADEPVEDDTPKTQNIYDVFSVCASDINAIMRHGAYDKGVRFQTNISDVENRVQNAQLDDKQKSELKNDLQNYKIICKKCITTMKEDAPKLAEQYKTLIGSLQQFDSMVNSTGFPPLLKAWHKLTRIKQQYMKKPSLQNEKEFYETLELVTITVRELYLDDNMEEPMLHFLKNYKEYFVSLDTSYKNIDYDKVNSLKPLAYKIKSQIQLNIPNNL